MDLPPLPADAPRRLLLGFSGGRDSTALLHRLATAKGSPWVSLRAVHVHHGLHADADRWADHCASQAAALGVECAVRRVAVTHEGRGLEEAARRARYAAFAAERRNDECLVLAHHRDDQAETLLLALLRGSGERGLSAMRGLSVDARGPIWRPLLETPAADVAAYANAHGLAWIDDPSNADTRFSRNRLRHEVMPLLRRHWPQADAALAQSARHLADADALASRQARADLATLQGLAGDTLDATALRGLSRARATRALRAWGEGRDAALTTDAIERVLGDWGRLPRGRALQHTLGRHVLRQWNDRLWLTLRDALDAPDASRWDGREPLALGGGNTLSLVGADGFDPPLALVHRDAAPRRFRAAGDAHSRPLKVHFAALGVPPWMRDAVPLLVDGDGDLQALGDLAYGAAFDDWLRRHGARLLWQAAVPGG
ncbi:MAG: tRNA lysidine(34) synthetase TilS [Silanimonas sp.]